MNEKKKESLFETGEFEISDHERASIKAKDIEPLISLIKNTIDSDSWDSESGSISPYPANLCFVVAQTKSGQKKIQSLLKKLRGLNDVMLKLESHLVIVDESSDLIDDSVVATTIEDYKSKIETATANALGSSAFPSAVLFNGEAVTHPRSTVADSKIGPFYLAAVVASDLNSVKLRCTDKVTPEISLGQANPLAPTVLANADVEAKPEVTVRINEVVEIANGGFAIIDVTPMLEKNEQNRKAILFVRSTISDQRKKQRDK